MIQKFIIEGNPRGQGRPKATIRGRHAGVYEDSKDRLYKENLAAQIVAQRPHFIPADVPVELEVSCFLLRPKYHYGAKGLKPRFEDTRPLGTPDVDNLGKAVMDSLNGIVWHDDSQIVRVVTEKHYADTRPHIVIEVRCPTKAVS